MSAAKDEATPKPSNFVRQIIERDLEAGTYAGRHFAGTPGDAAHHAAGPIDTARIRTRFPPEPNGYPVDITYQVFQPGLPKTRNR